MIEREFFSVQKNERSEIVIKKSRFISDIYPVFSEKEAVARLQQIKKEFPDARHHCYAYSLQENERHLQKFSDDGEPSGTAGKPIFNVIEKNQLSNVIIIVTRYFGGIKLGAGGLTRAYSSAAQAVVEKATKLLYKYSSLLKLELDYQNYSQVEQFLYQKNALILKKDFSQKVVLEIVPFEKEEELKKELVNLTNGQINIAELKKDFFSWEA